MQAQAILLLLGHTNGSYICTASREEASKPSCSRCAAKSKPPVSILQLRPPPPLQVLFLQQPPWHPVFGVLCHATKDPRYLCHASRSYFKVLLFPLARTPRVRTLVLGHPGHCWDVSIFLVSHGLHWWLILPFQSSENSSRFTDTSRTSVDHHGTEHLCRHLRARGARHLRWEDFPSWTSSTGLQVLQQTVGLSGLHEGAFEHSQFRERDGLTHVKGEKPKGFKYILIIRHASNGFLNQSSGNQMKKSKYFLEWKCQTLGSLPFALCFCSWGLQPVNNHIINGFIVFLSGKRGQLETKFCFFLPKQN